MWLAALPAATDWVWLGCLSSGVAMVLAICGGTVDSFLGVLGLVVLLGGIGRDLRTGWWRAMGIGAAAAVACRWAALGLGPWFGVTALLLSVGAAVGMGQSLGGRLFTFGGRVCMDGVVAGCALPWITLPLWFPLQRLTPTAMGWLTRVHPLMAMNSAVLSLGVWTEQPLPYRWTRLGQDLPYALPGGVKWAVALHSVLAGIGALLIWYQRSGRTDRFRRGGRLGG